MEEKCRKDEEEIQDRVKLVNLKDEAQSATLFAFSSSPRLRSQASPSLDFKRHRGAMEGKGEEEVPLCRSLPLMTLNFCLGSVPRLLINIFLLVTRCVALFEMRWFHFAVSSVHSLFVYSHLVQGASTRASRSSRDMLLHEAHTNCSVKDLIGVAQASQG